MLKAIYRYKNIILLLSNTNNFSMENEINIINNFDVKNIDLRNVCTDTYSKDNMRVIEKKENAYKIYKSIKNNTKGLFTLNNDQRVVFYDCNSKKNRGLFTDNINLKTVSIDDLGEGVIDLNSLFKNCINLEYVFIGENIFYLKNMSSMFENCKNLKNIYGFKNINTENVIYMSYMFAECNNLKIIDLSNFTTSNLQYCNHMFYNCHNLENINFKSNYYYKLFDFLTFTKENGDYSYKDNEHFYICGKDEIIILFSSDTVYENNKNNLIFNKLIYFYNKDLGIYYKNICLKTLEYLEFSKNNNFDLIEMYDELLSKYFARKYIIEGFYTSLVVDMSYMFCGCHNLKNLDIGSFKIKKCKNLKKMFYNCYNLEYLNIFKFKDYNVKNFSEIFENCHKLKTIQNNSKSVILNKLFIFKKNKEDNTIYEIINKKSLDNFSIIMYENLRFLEKKNKKYVEINIYNEDIFENIKKRYVDNFNINADNSDIINFDKIKNKNTIKNINSNENIDIITWFKNLKLYNDNIGSGLSAFTIKATDNLKNNYALKFISSILNSKLILNELNYKELKNIINKNLLEKNNISFSENHFIISNYKFKDKIYVFVSKYCENGTLANFIKNNKLKINLKDIIYLCGELIDILKEMDNIGMYHGDFSPNNIMIDDKFNLKLIDFSVSEYLKKIDNNKLIFKKEYLEVSKYGTILYFSPEQLIGEKIDIKYFNKVDIFAFGSIIYELLYQNFPYDLINTLKNDGNDKDKKIISMHSAIMKNEIINNEDLQKKENITNNLSYYESIIYDNFVDLLLMSLNKNIKYRASSDDLQNTFIYKLYSKNYKYLKSEFINKFFKYYN